MDEECNFAQSRFKTMQRYVSKKNWLLFCAKEHSKERFIESVFHPTPTLLFFL